MEENETNGGSVEMDVNTSTETTDQGGNYDAPSSEQDSDIWGLDQYKDQLSKQEEEKTEEATPQEPTETEKFSFAGREYTKEEIEAKLKDSYNFDKWQAKLTKEAQELAAQREQWMSERQGLEQQIKKPETEPTPEEKQFNEWLDKNGYVKKDALEQEIKDLREFKASFEEQEAMKQIVNELSETQKKYNLSDDDKVAIWNHARENNMTDLNMETVYLDMNKDKIMERLVAEQRESAGTARKERVAKVQSTRSNAQVDKTSLKKYDASRDKDTPLDQLIARWYSAE